MHEQREKRIWGISKQVCSGLEYSYGIKYGVAEMKNLVQVRARARARCCVHARAAHGRFLTSFLVQLARDEIEEDVMPRTEPAASVYKAALKYDLLTLCQVLNQKVRPKYAAMPAFSKTISGASCSVIANPFDEVDNKKFQETFMKIDPEKMRGF